VPNLDDVQILIPRIRRALEPGVASASAAVTYTDRMITEIAADAIGELMLIGGDAFPFTLNVAGRDVNNYPSAWTTSPALPEEIMSLVAIQAVVGQLYGEIRDLKTSETIANEGSRWEYTRSVTLLKDRLATLMRDRDLILAKIERLNPTLDQFVNLVKARAPQTQADVEGFYNAAGLQS